MGTGPVWAVRALGLLIAVPLVAMGTLSAVTWFVTTRTVTHRTETAAVKRLVLDTGVGDVTVRVIGSGETEVTTEERGAFRSPRATSSLKDGVLTLTGHCDSGWVPGGNCSADYVVLVPRGTAIEARCSVGDLLVRGADAELTAHSSVGDLTLEELSSPAVIATTDTGGIEAAFIRPPRTVRLDSSVGDDRVIVPADGTRYRVSLKSDVGDEFRQVPDDPSAEREISVTSSVGDVTVTTKRQG